MSINDKKAFEMALRTLADAAIHGIRYDLTDAEYFAHSAINCSGLKLIASKTPAHFKYQQTAPRKETPAMFIGSAVHCATLEPEAFDERYIVAPKIDKRTKDGKAAWAELEASGKVVLSEDDGEQVMRIAHAVRANKSAAKLLTNGKAEVAVFSEIDGQAVKCKCDYLRENVAVIDLKTTDDASEKGFMKSVLNYGYHQQAAFYMDVMQAVGQPVERFVFVVVEKTAPFLVAIHELSDEFVELGRELNRKALAMYEDCSITGNWYGYDENITLISPPFWAIKQVEHA